MRPQRQPDVPVVLHDPGARGHRLERDLRIDRFREGLSLARAGSGEERQRLGPRSPGDLTIRCTRRSRALVADSWTGTEVPLAEETEAYEVETLDGAVVKRRLTSGTTSVTYTSVQQTADWGELLGPGDTLDIRIFQLSALVGRGAVQISIMTF